MERGTVELRLSDKIDKLRLQLNEKEVLKVEDDNQLKMDQYICLKVNRLYKLERSFVIASLSDMGLYEVNEDTVRKIVRNGLCNNITIKSGGEIKVGLNKYNFHAGMTYDEGNYALAVERELLKGNVFTYCIQNEIPEEIEISNQLFNLTTQNSLRRFIVSCITRKSANDVKSLFYLNEFIAECVCQEMQSEKPEYKSKFKNDIYDMKQDNINLKMKRIFIEGIEPKMDVKKVGVVWMEQTC